MTFSRARTRRAHKTPNTMKTLRILRALPRYLAGCAIRKLSAPVKAWKLFRPHRKFARIHRVKIAERSWTVAYPDPALLLAAWIPLFVAGSTVRLLAADHCSSDYNQHSYLVDIDGIKHVCYREEPDDWGEIGPERVETLEDSGFYWDWDTPDAETE